MITTLAIALLAAGGLDDATMEEISAKVEHVQRTYDLDEALAIMPALQQKMNVSVDEMNTELRMMLAETTVLAATLLRYEYEEPDKSNKEKRALGDEIDRVSAIGLNALGGLPDISEKHRITADLLAMKMRTKFRGNKHHDAMEENINKALVRDPLNPKALQSQSRRKLFAEVEHGGDFPAGLKILNRAIELDPDDEAAFILRGLAFEREGMHAEAIADWEKAIELNPDAQPAKEHLQRLRNKESATENAVE